MKIPKIIHFIWAGGERALPYSNIQTVRSWANQNPSFQVWVWIDPSSSTSSFKLIDQYVQQFKNEKNIILHDIEGTKDDAGKVFSVSDEIVRYEINKLRPNYGRSSDRLRYKILEIFGGAYFDSDVKPGHISLQHSGIFEKEFDMPQIFIDMNSQNTGEVGNDAIICTPRNPAITQIKDTSYQHYFFHRNKKSSDILPICDFNISQNNSFYRLSYYSEDSAYVIQSTILQTGPYCVRKILLDNLKNLIPPQELKSEVKPMENLTYVVANHRNWIDIPIPIMIHSIAIKKIEETIKFEIEKFQILRLDDHVAGLMQSTRTTQDLATLEILNIISNVDISSVQCIQITYRFRETVEYCNQNNFQHSTYLFPLVKKCYENSQIHNYFEEPLLMIMSSLKSSNIQTLLETDIDNADSIIKENNKVLKSVSDFVDNALSYCMDELIYNNKLKQLSGPQKTIVSKYIDCILKNLEQNKRGLQCLRDYLATFRENNDPEDHIDRLKKIRELIKINDSLIQTVNHFKMRHGLAQDPKLIRVLDDQDHSFKEEKTTAYRQRSRP